MQRTFFKHKNYSRSAQRPQQWGDVNVGPTHLVQLPAEALKDVVFVDLENWFALIEDSVHDHAKGVHVRSGVAADRQNVLRGQVLGVGEAEGWQVGIPLFTRVLRLRSRRGQWNTDVTTQLEVTLVEQRKGFPPHTSESEGLVDEMLKSKPMIFQEPLLLRMMFSGHRFPWTILTPLWRKDKPSEI